MSRRRRAVRITVTVLAVAGTAAAAWLVISVVGGVRDGIESVSLDDPGAGYEPITTTSTTTTTTTTLPPRDLEVSLIGASGSSAGPGFQLELREIGPDGSAGVIRVASTDADGVARWLDLGVPEAEISVPTSCGEEPGDPCLVDDGAEPHHISLERGLNSAEIRLASYTHNSTTSGIVSTDEVWSTEVFLTGTVVVPAGVHLLVEPGTRVTVAGEDDGAYLEDRAVLEAPPGIAIWAEGRLAIRGTEREPVVMAPQQEDGAWSGLFGSIDAEHLDITAAREIRLFDAAAGAEAGPSPGIVTGSVLRADLISVASGSGFHHNVIEAERTAFGIGGVGLHHNRFLGAGQSACVELDGLSNHRLHNNLLIECPLLVESRPDTQTFLPPKPPLVMENNTFATVRRQTRPAISIHNQGPVIREGSVDRSQFDTVEIVFVNNIVYGAWPEGFLLGYRPIHTGSFFSNNAFFGLVFHSPRGHFDVDNNYTYGGDLQREAIIPVNGVAAVDLVWRELTGHNWSGTARAFDVVEDPLFTDLFGKDFTLRAGSPAIDAGHFEIRDADGTASDLGAYGGPGGADWD